MFPGLVSSPGGVGWTHPYPPTVRPEDGTNQRLYCIAPEGYESEYLRIGTDSYWIAINPGELRGTITLNTSTHIYELADLDGTKTDFYDSSGLAAGPAGVWGANTARWGNQISRTYSSGNLTMITDSEGTPVQ